MANGGMSEAAALGYFFTTSNGLFTANTAPANTAAWPHVACTACHYVPPDHVDNAASLASFDSRTAQYTFMDNQSQLCGQCHGNLRFADTDHLVYNAWAASKHANTQTAVAGELSGSHPGETPAAVTQGEDCIACHAPTAVLANGGMSESGALGYFFATSNGLFTASTTPANTNAWPHVACTACHDPHDPGTPSYFNSATAEYQIMTNSSQLCGQCHGNLRFPHTDHLSYNIVAGTGGIGVTNAQTMPGVTCTDCHMYDSGVDPSNSKSFHGHSWAITVTEPDGSTTTSCTQCHPAIDTAMANLIIGQWQSEFQTLDATASAAVARAAAAMVGVQDTNLLATLAAAQQNLAYAESDESGGFHNFSFLKALLTAANDVALSLPILNVGIQGANVTISWTGPGALQSAGSVTGPWQDVPGATNPLVVAPTLQGQCQFYRLRPN